MNRTPALLLPLLLCVAGPAHGGPTLPPVEGNQLMLEQPVVFETGGEKLRTESDPALEQVKTYLEVRSYVSLLRIEVHSDSQGQTAANQKLSERRALSVARALVARGVDCRRLLPVGFGESKPVADNGTAEGRAKNRRTAFVNAALRGHPIGGMPVDGGGPVAGDPCHEPGPPPKTTKTTKAAP